MPTTPKTNRVVDATPHRDGHTTPHQQQGLAPRLPHERDESADSQTGEPQPIIDQARRDVERGLVDTDRGPVVDKLYNDRLGGHDAADGQDYGLRAEKGDGAKRGEGGKSGTSLTADAPGPRAPTSTRATRKAT